MPDCLPRLACGDTSIKARTDSKADPGDHGRRGSLAAARNTNERKQKQERWKRKLHLSFDILSPGPAG